MEHKDFTAVAEALRGMGYTVSCFDTAAEAADYLNAQVDGKTVGFGGSKTLEALGLYESLSRHNTVYWHWRVPEGKSADDVRREAASAEIYFSSANGLAETGEIVNIDGGCNRIASIFYGHQKVYLVVGENKLAPDYDRALFRARNVAAPLNAKRFAAKTPCVAGGRCFDCKSPARLCRGLAVMLGKPSAADYEVVLIHESLGF